MPRPGPHTVLASLALAPLLACDAQVDGDHQGDALATLTGSVTTPSSGPPDGATVALAWMTQSGGLTSRGTNVVEVEGTFPASFSLSLFEPPADDLLREMDDGYRFGNAYIVAGAAGATAESLDNGHASGSWIGVDLTHVLVYLPETPPAESTTEAILRGRPGPGYHLYDAHTLTEGERDEALACLTAHDPGGDPANYTTYDQYQACGNIGRDTLTLSADDLGSVLGIELGDEVYQQIPEW